jgi:signal transduction histidine kinase
MLAEELGRTFLFDGLSPDQLDALAARGEEMAFEGWEVLFRAGEPAEHLWVLLEGRIELFRHEASEMVPIATMDTPGRWAGGFTAWGDASDASTGYRATGLAKGRGRVFRLASADLAELLQAWLPLAVHLVKGLFGTVRTIEAEARQRQAMVALGQLSAGLAHELNNPAAAAVRAAASLRAAGAEMLESLTDLARLAVSAEQYIALDELRRTLPGMAPDGALARADAEDALTDWLADHGVEDGWRIASTLVGAGVDASFCEGVAALLAPVPPGAAIRWISSTLVANSLLDDVEDTTTRISTLVADAKAYSQFDRAERQVTDLHEGIRSTLSMLRERLADGVTVVLDLDPAVPPLEAYASALDQVWTNLVVNAVDAMDGHGTLTVTTRLDGDHVTVAVADTGSGIPPEVLQRIFEPFFTTKDVGKGTGLGLDITRRIVVDRHGGDIVFDSRPGNTVARVRLPLRGLAG